MATFNSSARSGPILLGGLFSLVIAFFATGVGFPVEVSANPTGGTVTAGTATIGNPTGASTVITQGSNRAIIDWDSFSIGTGQITTFLQPSAASAILNRVMGSDPSTLLGQLKANGEVFLINPNGIVVGQGATINAAAFGASTLDVARR